MGSIDIIKSLSTVLSRPVNKSLLQRIYFFSQILRNVFGHVENQTRGLLGEKLECYSSTIPPPFYFLNNMANG